MPDRTPTAPDLAVLALRYAAGDLTAAEMDAFEERLADDQPARDALAEAIRLSASALGQSPPTPSPAVRKGVRERLFPTRLTRLFPRRSYRGHPAAWAALGGALTAAAALLLVSLGGEDSPAHSNGWTPVDPPSTRSVPMPPPSEPLTLPETDIAAPMMPPPEPAPGPLTGPRAVRADEPPTPVKTDPANG